MYITVAVHLHTPGSLNRSFHWDHSPRVPARGRQIPPPSVPAKRPPPPPVSGLGPPSPAVKISPYILTSCQPAPTSPGQPARATGRLRLRLGGRSRPIADQPTQITRKRVSGHSQQRCGRLRWLGLEPGAHRSRQRCFGPVCDRATGGGFDGTGRNGPRRARTVANGPEGTALTSAVGTGPYRPGWRAGRL